MLYGLFALPWWGYIIVYMLLTHITIISMSIFLHRNQAHHALNLHPSLSHFFRFWLWLTTGMNTKEWTSVHRKHHAHCETEHDPHSPQVKGIKTVFFAGTFLYSAEAANPETLARYGHGTPDDRIEQNLYSRYRNMGLVLLLIIDLVLFGLPGILFWGAQMLWVPLCAAGIINGIGHYWGYRNFECKDASTNIVPWGILIAGEELHNNHHTYPTSAKFSIKPWEVDITWLYIKLFSKFGLVTVKRVPPELYTKPEKQVIDLETVKAILINRFQVLAQYSKKVISPVYHEVKKKNIKNKQHLPRQIKQLLIREETIIDQNHQQHLNTILEREHNLQVVYHFRKQLQNIWSKKNAPPHELLEALQNWCHLADKTGIKVLQAFVVDLHSYTIAPKAKSA